jgi:2-alkyl-3-oxoalkanoate reductase
VLLERMGAVPVVGDVFAAESLTRLIAASDAELVMHQLTAFGTTDSDPYAETIRVRIDGTRSLVAAARAAGARRFIAQSISFMCSRFGTGLTDEDTPLYLDGPRGVRALADAIASLERQTLDAYGTSGMVLRYGWFYGPGTSYDPNDSIPTALRAGTLPIAVRVLGPTRSSTSETPPRPPRRRWRASRGPSRLTSKVEA